ncbi:MAG: aminodeoxychorismate/anthranilate synthase component II [Bacteroidetes bacterium]|nr:MAG: aminodeoxychorismate/anthranilate synthase component II [Bacteroidota bacterium]
MNILILDNYDSFTYNLVQYIQEILEQKVDVYRNDAISLEDVDAYDAIVLSPGPGLPKDAGIMPELIKMYAGKKPILGVCLGHQAIVEAFGGDLENLERVYHGMETPIQIIGGKDDLFESLPETIHVGRYHSWVAKKDQMPESIEVTAVDEKGEVMAIQHKNFKIRGVQFHPESIMTKDGKTMLKNFFDHCVENGKGGN